MAGSEERIDLVSVSGEDQDDPNTQCMICLGVMENPFVTLCCGKSFCEACIKRQKEEWNKCPNCNTTSLEIQLNRDLKAVIDAQRVYCFHQPDGCEWVGERGDHSQHLMSCDWHMGDCKYGCGHSCLGKDMEKHYAEKYKDHTRRQEEHLKRLEAEDRSKTLLINSLTAEVETLRRERVVWIYGLIILSVLLAVYIHTQNQQTEVSMSPVAKIESVSPVAKIGSVPPVNVLNHSDFKFFSAFITRTDLTLTISFSAVFFSADLDWVSSLVCSNCLIRSFNTSVIVRVQDTTTTYYDQRVNVTFTPTDVENRYFSESKKLIDVRKFNSEKLEAGIIDIEITSFTLQWWKNGITLRLR